MSAYRVEVKLKSWIKATARFLYVFLLSVSPAAFGADDPTFGDKLTFPNPKFTYEVQPGAGRVEGFHLVVRLERQVGLGNLHLLRVARVRFGEVAVDGRVDQLQSVKHAIVPHVDALGGVLAVDRVDAFQPLRPLIDVDQCLIYGPEGSLDHDLQIVVPFLHDKAWQDRRPWNLRLVVGEGRELVRDVADRIVGLARFRPLQRGHASRAHCNADLHFHGPQRHNRAPS